MVYCKGNVFFPKNQTFCPKFQGYGGVMGDNGSVSGKKVVVTAMV